ncbi:MAG TPA: hypothetical protein VEV17_17465 [Bryobacteraceae bacterium]|nr:hypothetical protein [Bryobacteraceae bacterium]
MKHFVLIAGLVAGPAVLSCQQYRAAVRVDPNDPRLARLQQYFAQRDCPLRAAAADFLVAADLNALDWRLLPSISMVESSGGKDYRNNNVLGWDSCRRSFASIRAGIHFVAAQLAKSVRYKDKGLDAKLRIYNPQPGYLQKVKAVMAALGPIDPDLEAVN